MLAYRALIHQARYAHESIKRTMKIYEIYHDIKNIQCKPPGKKIVSVILCLTSKCHDVVYELSRS